MSDELPRDNERRDGHEGAGEPSPRAPGALFPHEYRVFVRESHLDTFGHVNNATYLTLFEEARWDLITQAGLGLENIHTTRIGPVILEATVKFRREVKNRETLSIVTTPGGQEGSLFRLVQRASKTDGRLAAEATFLMAVWDLDARRIIAPPPDWQALIDGLVAR